MSDLISAIGPSTFLWPVAVLGVLALSIALERFYFLSFQATLATDSFMGSVQKLVMAGQVEAAVVLCIGSPRALVANVVRAALLSADADREDLRLAIEQSIAEAVPVAQRRLGWLTALANVATLMGLLGTIVGLMQSFDAVSHADPAQRQTLLAGGIALAMRTTASGIAVAIPSLLAYAHLAQRANALLDDVDRCGMKIEMLLVSGRRARLAPAPAAEREA